MKKLLMLANIEKGLLLQIGGEAGENHTLPWAMLKEIGDNLQALVHTLAKYDLDTTAPIDMKNFDIEVNGFFKGSAVPSFKLNSKPTPLLISDYKKQRQHVSEKLDSLLQVAHSGHYNQIPKLYALPIVRNEIVENLFSFVRSFRNAPVSVVKKQGRGFAKIYSINKFKPELKTQLMTSIVESVNIAEKQEEILVAKVKRTEKDGKKFNKVLEFYHQNTIVSIAPLTINVPGKQYILNFPLYANMYKEDDYYVVQNEMLDLIGTGPSEDDAENSFNQEFDFVYSRYSSIPNRKLSERLQKIKTMLNVIVKEVISI